MSGKRRVFGAAFKAKVALAAARCDRTTAQLASHGIHTSQVTAWKKQLMGQLAELFVDGRQRRPDQTTDEQELYEQIGRLKMEVEWLKKGCWESSGSDCLPNGSDEPSLARMPCQRTVFLKDKAIAGLPTGLAPRKVFCTPHFGVEARGCGRLRAGVLSATCGGLMHGTRESF